MITLTPIRQHPVLPACLRADLAIASGRLRLAIHYLRSAREALDEYALTQDWHARLEARLRVEWAREDLVDAGKSLPDYLLSSFQRCLRAHEAVRVEVMAAREGAEP